MNITPVNYNLNQRNVTFGSKAKIDWDSITKVMPEQTRNFFNVKALFEKNGIDDIVEITAKKNKVQTPFIEVRIFSKDNTSGEILSGYDSRKLGEIASFMDMEDYYKVNYGNVPKSLQEEHKTNMLKIEAEQPNFGEISLDTYNYYLLGKGLDPISYKTINR